MLNVNIQCVTLNGQALALALAGVFSDGSRQFRKLLTSKLANLVVHPSVRGALFPICQVLCPYLRMQLAECDSRVQIEGYGGLNVHGLEEKLVKVMSRGRYIVWQ
jgi:hypothetical protein